ncbi:MAG: Ca-activated chloride channel [Pyrinomonadaceae bacterium]|jgi:Ca-activated chloride channel family protein|nr:Ca-activated chloride channel [Pyrinomonadaceae bacterium]
MKRTNERLILRRLRPKQVALVVALVFAVTCLVGSSFVAARSQDSRPRRSSAIAPRSIPTATPTPTPVPARPAQTPAQTTLSRPTPTPTPVPRTTPIDRVAPTLGEPPPAPILKPKPTPTPPEPEIDEGSTIVVNTELVTLNVRVIDRNNRPIDNVRENEFHVFEDGVPQPIETFSREEVPISYGLAVDTSGSLRSQLQAVIDAGKTIINSNKAGDETFLVRFIGSDQIVTVQDFTANKELLMDGLDNFYVEGGQTAIIDAVYLSAEHVAEYKKGDDNDHRRRALIVITDGEDRNSFFKEPQLFQRLREEDVQIYVIGFINELDKDAGFIRKSPRDKAVALINRLATETGGRAFFPQSVSELPQIANEIVRDLRTQYVLSYNPTNKLRDGTFRAIRVVVDDASSHDKRIALTRNGRIVPVGNAAPRPPAGRTTTKPAVGTNKRP